MKGQSPNLNYSYKNPTKSKFLLLAFTGLFLFSAFNAEAKKKSHKKDFAVAKIKTKKATKTTTTKTIRVSSNHAVVSEAPNANVLPLRQSISRYAENFLGLPYVLGGYSQTNGFDCSGFTRFILGNFNINTGLNALQQSKIGEQIPVDWTRPGDLIFFGTKDNISHVALVFANDEKGITIVHSCSRGVVKENITNSGYWKPKMLFAINIVGM
jgi:cell wall-associated NlpC family hydrolase